MRLGKFIRTVALTTPVLLGASVVLYSEISIRRLERLVAGYDAPGGESIEIDNNLIHYETQGAGPTIVLTHGFGGSTYSWRKNIGPLATAGYRVVALDLLGFGYSSRTSQPVYTARAQASLVRSFLDVLDGQNSVQGDNTGEHRYILIGNSLGAGVVLCFALDYPDATRAVVCTAPVVSFSLPWRRARPLFRIPLLGRLLARTIYFYALAGPSAAARMIAAAYGERIEDVSVEMREEMLRPLQVRGSADSALGLALSYDARPFMHDLEPIRSPVLVVAGARDAAVPLSSVRNVYERLPNAEMVILPRAGHLVQEDEPERFNNLVLDFLSRTAITPQW